MASGIEVADWSVSDLVAYMESHGDTESWDGAPWPLGIGDDENGYVCPVCRFTYPAPDHPHDCEDNVWRDSRWANDTVAQFARTHARD